MVNSTFTGDQLLFENGPESLGLITWWLGCTGWSACYSWGENIVGSIECPDSNHILQAPQEIQQVMSAHMTSILSGAIPSFELFMSQWEKLSEEHFNPKAWTDIRLKWATKYYKQMDDTNAYVISMCEFFCHNSINFFWIFDEVINPCICFS